MIIEAITDMENKFKTDLNIASKRKVKIPNDDQCPICKTATLIVPITGLIIDAGGPYHGILSVFCYCPHCKSTYINTYTHDYGTAAQKVRSEPNRFEKLHFDVEIEKLSPSFVEIVNQAIEADCSHLNQIAGMGYRKALEFLIKDYAIYRYPDKKENIKSAPLSQVIKNYIDDPKIKKLAETTSWIGNDETHYVRKHTDRDIEDLKRFVSACVNFINMDLIYQDSQTVERK